MTAYRDYIAAFRKIGFFRFAKLIISEISEDGLTVWATALAYSWIFAAFPFLIFLISLVAFVPGDKDGRVRVVTDFLAKTIPNTPTAREARAVQEGKANAEYSTNPLVREIPKIVKNQSGKTLSLSILLALWSASGGMATTMSALNRCYDIRRDRPYYIHKPVAIGLTLIVMALILVVLLLLPVVGGLITWVEAQGTGFSTRFHLSWPVLILIDLLRWSSSAALMFFTVAVIYHFGPKPSRRFRFLTPGAVFTVFSWLLLGLALKYYVANFAASSYSKTYGAVGGVILLLFTFYLDALVLLIGAEINSELDFAVFGRASFMRNAGEPEDPCDPSSPDGGHSAPGSQPAPPAATPSPSVLTKLAFLGAGLLGGTLVAMRLRKPNPQPEPRVLSKRGLLDRYSQTYKAIIGA